jgi:hypothetical protein
MDSLCWLIDKGNIVNRLSENNEDRAVAQTINRSPKNPETERFLQARERNGGLLGAF